MRRHFETVEAWLRRVGAWANQAETWQVIAVAVLVLMLLPMLPAVLVLALIAGVVLFARAWLREFVVLMGLGDNAFPGAHDKLIWAILMIVLPPVGVYLFRSYRLSALARARLEAGRDVARLHLNGTDDSPGGGACDRCTNSSSHRFPFLVAIIAMPTIAYLLIACVEGFPRLRIHQIAWNRCRQRLVHDPVRDRTL